MAEIVAISGVANPQVQPFYTRPRSTRRNLHLSAVHAGEAIVFKVKDFDPTKHPRGYKGMFIDTPNKTAATNANVGDVIVSKGGKAFKVEKQTEKGVKVKPIDLDSGAIKSGYTVLGNDTKVAVFAPAKPINSQAPIDQMPPGTIVQHPKSGKRFEVAKHGKWTTVYPVDDSGQRTGKHTVLPGHTLMIVSASGKVTHHVTEEQVKATADNRFKKPELPPAPSDRVAAIASKWGFAPAFASKIPFFANRQHKEEWLEENFDDPTVQDTKDFVHELEDVEAEYKADMHQYAKDLDLYDRGRALSQMGVTTGTEKEVSDRWQTLLDTRLAEIGFHDHSKLAALIMEDRPQTKEGVLDAIKAKALPAEQKDMAGIGPWLMNHGGEKIEDFRKNAVILPDAPQLDEDTIRKNLVSAADIKGELPPHEFEKLLKGEYKGYYEGEGAVPFLEDRWTEAHDGVPDPVFAKPLQAVGKEIDKQLAKHRKDVAKYDALVEARLTSAASKPKPNIDIPDPVYPPEVDTQGFAEDRWGRSMIFAEEAYKALQKAGVQVPQGALDDPDGWWEEHVDATKYTGAGGPDNQQFFHEYLDKGASAWHTKLGLDLPNSLGIDPYSHAAITVRNAVGLGYQGENDKTTIGGSAADYLAKNVQKVYRAEASRSKKIAAIDKEHAAKLSVSNMVQGDEVLPGKLPIPPKRYPPGVGKHTVIVVDDLGEDGRVSLPFNQEQKDIPKYGRKLRVKRVPADDLDSPGTLLGYETAVGRALSLARSQPAHEKIVRRNHSVTNTGTLLSGDLKPGDHVVMRDNQVVVIDKIEHSKNLNGVNAYGPKVDKVFYSPLWVDMYRSKSGTSPSYALFYPEVKPGHEWITRETGMVPAPPEMVSQVEAQIKKVHDTEASYYKPSLGIDQGKEVLDPTSRTKLKEVNVAPSDYVVKELKKRGGYKVDEQQIRGARPERYIPELRNEWDMDQLYKLPTNTALKTLGKLGWREITPRRQGNPRLINANGRRLQLIVQDGRVIHVDEPKVEYIGESSSSTDFHDQLAAVLQTGGDLKMLDPRQSPDLESRNSLARTMLYDMARGKQNHIEAALGKKASTQKVVTDAEYEAKLQDKYPLAEFEKQVKSPPITIRARGVTIEAYGLKEDAAWNYEARQLEVPKSFTTQEQAALMVIANGTYTANELRAENPDESIYQAAERLEKGEYTSEKLDKSVMIGMLKENYTKAEEQRTAQKVANLKIAQNLQKQAMKDEIAKLRKKENTVASPVTQSSTTTFDLPVWDEVALQPQNPEDIQQLVNGIGNKPTDVPVFFTGGVIEDGIAQFGANKIYAKSTQASDELVISRLQAAGAEKTVNSFDLQQWFGYASTGTLHRGDMYLIADDSDAIMTDTAKVTNASLFLQKRLKDVGYDDEAEKIQQTELAVATKEQSYQQFVDAAKGVLEGKEGKSLGYVDLMETELIPHMQALFTKAGKGKRIEYVPYAQDGDLKPQGGVTTGAPTSQRGQIRMTGYTVEEGIEKLKELGLVHDLEPEVPYTTLFRSDRRYGRVAPILPEYLSGEAALPKIKKHVFHGVTGKAALTDILRTGALLPISERIRHNLKVGGASPNGDVRSGIDMGIFASAGSTGWGNIKFQFKDNVYLRRDILVAPSDFGGSATRYDSYKTYANKLRKAAGEETGSLYLPLGPGARQHWIDTVNYNASNEWNPVPGVALEDIATITVPNAAEAQKAREVLQELIKEGFISEVPEVVG